MAWPKILEVHGVHVRQDTQLTKDQKAKFYSHWSYDAIRLHTDIPSQRTAMLIAVGILPSALVATKSNPEDGVE